MHERGWVTQLLRPGAADARAIRTDCLWLIGIALALIATGIGLRDPWPADEPRFALIARDMAASHEWLLPRVGGDIYADKPPLYFWLIATGLAATGSLRIAFLLPSLLASLLVVLLTYDLARRLWNRETGLVAGLALLGTLQFIWQTRQAQIDATLCFWTTLGLYGLLRHLLLGPAWRWYTIGWAAAGFGVITKGVGFLPLLVLLPYALLRPPHWLPRYTGPASARWLIGPAAFLLAIAVWLVPMLLAAKADPTLAAYRDEILFRQTIDRYSEAWHHREPFWYFIVNVIPWLWLPLTALLPWLVLQWRDALRARDLRIALLLAWIALVVLFFSLSTGKRGVYVLPAVPAFVLAASPYLRELATRTNVRRTIFAVAVAIPLACGLAAIYLLVRPDERLELVANYDFDAFGPLLALALVTACICLAARVRHAFLAYAGALASVLWIVSFWVNPAMNDTRSGRAFMERVEAAADPDRELGILSFKEQYLLMVRRPIVHFGHARWREAEQEAADAAAWLERDRDRQLVVDDYARGLCFARAQAVALGNANREQWYLVTGDANPACVASGDADTAHPYRPPLEQ